MYLDLITWFDPTKPARFKAMKIVEGEQIILPEIFKEYEEYGNISITIKFNPNFIGLDEGKLNFGYSSILIRRDLTIEFQKMAFNLSKYFEKNDSMAIKTGMHVRFFFKKVQ